MRGARLRAKIQEQAGQFSGKVSAGLPKVARRMVGEVVYGIQARGDVKLSEIGRAWGRSGVALKKMIERLGRQLGRRGVRARIGENLLELAAERVGEETLLVLDGTDVTKPYARKMEHLAQVRDGSTGEKANGYWCIQVLAARRQSAEVVPLYQELYSHEAPGFRSENDEILRAIGRVSEAVRGRGVWVVDRGGDRKELLRPLLEKRLSFLIRMRGDRHVVWRRQKKAVTDVAGRVKRKWSKTVIKEDGAREKAYHLRFGATTVRFPGFDDHPLSLVVIDGFGKRPLMLLTTLRTGRARNRVWRVVQSYLARWRVEETIRYIKQSYRLEDIRLLTYERLRTMMTLVMAVAYFACAYLGRKAKLKILLGHVMRASQRIFGLPEFRYYAIADGVREILYGRPARSPPVSQPAPGPELELFPPSP